MTRKASKNKLIAGEVKAVHLKSSPEIKKAHKVSAQKKPTDAPSSEASLSAQLEQRRTGEEAIFKSASSGVSATAKPAGGKQEARKDQRTGAGGTPSPTLSEYDTCDPWDDY